MRTCVGVEVNDKMFFNRLEGLVNQFYKILPIRESGEVSLPKYLLSLQREMIGLKELIVVLENDAQYLSLLSILQYMITHDCDVATVKTDVFKAINIIKHMQKRFAALTKER